MAFLTLKLRQFCQAASTPSWSLSKNLSGRCEDPAGKSQNSLLRVPSGSEMKGSALGEDCLGQKDTGHGRAVFNGHCAELPGLEARKGCSDRQGLGVYTGEAVRGEVGISGRREEEASWLLDFRYEIKAP